MMEIIPKWLKKKHRKILKELERILSEVDAVLVSGRDAQRIGRILRYAYLRDYYIIARDPKQKVSVITKNKRVRKFEIV